jgi:hypothetical protein
VELHQVERAFRALIWPAKSSANEVTNPIIGFRCGIASISILNISPDSLNLSGRMKEIEPVRNLPLPIGSESLRLLSQ